MASKPPPPKKPTTGEDLKKVWSQGPLGEKVAKSTFDPAEAWLKKPEEVEHSKVVKQPKGGKKRRTLRKRKSTRKRR
jgi:hypothetical protein